MTLDDLLHAGACCEWPKGGGLLPSPSATGGPNGQAPIPDAVRDSIIRALGTTVASMRQIALAHGVSCAFVVSVNQRAGVRPRAGFRSTAARVRWDRECAA